MAEFVGADRGLKRLTVTAIDVADLDQPTVIRPDDSLAKARQAMQADGSRWAVVVGDEGELRGWVGLTDATGRGAVGDRARRMVAWVPAEASLKQAFSEMLQHDAGWVAVLGGPDNGRYLGVLTPDSLHAALRRSVDDADGVELTPSVSRS